MAADKGKNSVAAENFGIVDKTEALALIKRCEAIRDGKDPRCNCPYPVGPQRAAVDAQIEDLKRRFEIE